MFEARSPNGDRASNSYKEAIDDYFPTKTKPRVLLASIVLIACHKSMAFTQTGGYLYRETSKMRKRSVLRL
jgi:hypothetical protein